MSETFFIGDTHFSHLNILKFELIARPFANVEEMDEVLIAKWNKVVTPHDTVYHLGDFCFGNVANVAIADELNGTKILIMGNHDRYPIEEYLKYFKSVHGILFWKNCILTHVPVHPTNLEKRSKFNIHGHTHSKSILRTNSAWHLQKDDPRYLNVSCENIDLTPISADELFRGDNVTN